jgi:RNA polymerase sigma factor (TIGR02999 family)
MRRAQHEVTDALEALRGGDRDALDRVLSVVYEELRRIARRQLRGEREGHTLTTTALVHEAYLKLVKQDRVAWSDRAHFLAVAAQAMRRILVDYARRHRATRRGGPTKTALPIEALDGRGITVHGLADSAGDEAEALLTLDAALERLGTFSPRLARIVEYRFYAGLSEKETAEVLGVSQRTVARDWVVAKGWLYQELHDNAD